MLSHFHVDQLLCSILHKKRTYYRQWALYCVQHYDISVCWLIAWGAVSTCIDFWSMNMTGVYACLFEAVCDVTTVPSHLKEIFRARLVTSRVLVEKNFQSHFSRQYRDGSGTPNISGLRQKKISIAFLAPISWLAALATSPKLGRLQKIFNRISRANIVTSDIILATFPKLDRFQSHFSRQNRD